MKLKDESKSRRLASSDTTFHHTSHHYPLNSLMSNYLLIIMIMPVKSECDLKITSVACVAFTCHLPGKTSGVLALDPPS